MNCTSKISFCENKTENFSGICNECLKESAKKFWEFIFLEKHEKSRHEVRSNNNRKK